MASIVEPQNDPGDVEGVEQALKEAITQDNRPEETKVRPMEPSEVTKQKQQEQHEQEEQNPLAGTKFEGKSMEDLLESYNNLQSAYGRMANDLGTQRKLTDQLLNLKREEDLSSNEPAPLPEVDTNSLLDNPTQTLDRYISEREARLRKEYDERLSQYESQLQTDRFMQKHPDFMELGQSTKFREWATGDPIRARVANAAAQGDWEAADTLLTQYKQAQANPAADAASKEGLEAARKAGTESAASAGASSSDKVYRRADLIELKLRKPHVYSDPAFQNEILKAYSEGRVK